MISNFDYVFDFKVFLCLSISTVQVNRLCAVYVHMQLTDCHK